MLLLVCLVFSFQAVERCPSPDPQTANNLLSKKPLLTSLSSLTQPLPCIPCTCKVPECPPCPVSFAPCPPFTRPEPSFPTVTVPVVTTPSSGTSPEPVFLSTRPQNSSTPFGDFPDDVSMDSDDDLLDQGWFSYHFSLAILSFSDSIP